ncbi:hypothetical protein GCM10022223_17610 [Kineosporia mesophila]|uniref:Nudix hydrolase domain-containing protein n=1 Tax=Kineosporia mesophila TaxID=566012 RepID=A0ABP6Z9F2_9ACTN|nr:NUDIX hydrolase [Kineosporia mesophila]MCD5352001.1 NUDIX hydrolase [Kineosporia mesophila]
MTTFGLVPGAIEFLDDDAAVGFVETAAPELSAEHRTAMNAHWHEAAQANAALFDGPVAAVTGVRDDVGGRIEVSWARTTYRRHALRRVPGAPTLSWLFAAVVQPTPAGVLLGRMAAWTASGPGQWVLPGGSMEPPEAGQAMNEELIRRHAARELREETGLTVEPGHLERWALVRSAQGNVGFVYHAPPQPEAIVRRCFSGHIRREREHGEQAELTGVAFVGGPQQLEELDGPAAVSVPPLLSRYWQRAQPDSSP